MRKLLDRKCAIALGLPQNSNSLHCTLDYRRGAHTEILRKDKVSICLKYTFYLTLVINIFHKISKNNFSILRGSLETNTEELA